MAMMRAILLLCVVFYLNAAGKSVHSMAIYGTLLGSHFYGYSSIKVQLLSTWMIVLRDSDPVILVSNWCLCEASTAVYNHIVALLFQTEHYSELDVQVVPPVHSCTETEQQWHKPRTAGVKPGPINKMVITRPRPTWLMEGGIRNTLYKGLVGDPLDISLLQIGDTYKDFDITE
ncbi:uncharacterized protein LOC127445448 isoform X2 [Myxocyprinus asiaticus]|uniref:uncharacterized protein LOC127445448 isoform X2 n=1 Tax=Myxocyprinus asiaticus TaxID=70543 RepID=UPI002223A70D|nr:uncharacterized protein LOC127445448 isoform X2 [Myxocyprinus asiaticus]